MKTIKGIKHRKALAIILVIIAISLIGIIVTRYIVEKNTTANVAKYEVAEALTTEDRRFEYAELSDGTMEISKYVGPDTEVTIPSTIDGKNVTSIGRYAFGKRSSLTEITIPDSVTSIGNAAFYGCSSLTEIKVNTNNPNFISEKGVLFDKGQTKLLCYPAGKQDSVYKILDGVTSIGSDAFYGCSSLTEITIPDSVTSIESDAFLGCSSLTEIIIPEGVTSIESFAFYGCSSLAEITIPDGVTSIGSYAFYGCSSLVEITIPDSVTSIGSYAFKACSSLTEIRIPDSVTSVGSSAFEGCSSLTEITIPDSVTSIVGSYVFSGCDNVTIYCNSDSVAETYAKNNSIPYVIIPRVTISPNEMTYTNESTITVYATASDPSGIERVDILGWYKGDAEPNGNSKWKTVTATYDSVNDRYYATLSFSELPDMISGNTNNGEGEYRIKAYAYNNHGNYDFDGSVEVIYDTTLPTATISPSEITYTNEPTITVYATASDDVELNNVKIYGWYQGDTVQNGKSQYNVYEAQYDSENDRYYATLTFSELKNMITGNTNNGEGEYRIKAYAWDKAGNEAFDGSVEVIYDTTPPTQCEQIEVFGPRNDGYTITVSEITDTLSGVESVKFMTYTLNNAKDDLVEGSGTFDNMTNVWIYEVKTSDHNQEAGRYCTEVYAYDNAGNSIKLGEVTADIADNISPTCRITADKTSPTNASSITYTFTFSEEVTGFTADDIAVTNGTKGSFTKLSSTKYTLVVTNSESCTQTITVPAGVCTDVAGNSNTPAATKSIIVDRTLPTATISTSATATNQPTVTIYIYDLADEGGAGIKGTDAFAWFGTTWQGNHQTQTTTYDSANDRYYATFTFADIPDTSTGETNNGEGTYILCGNVRDNAGNLMQYSKRIIYDVTAPTITVSPSSASPEKGKSVDITITAAEAGGSGFSSSNKYEYQLGTSASTAPRGTWSTYESGTPITLGADLNGEYYLWVRTISDAAGNTSTSNGETVGSYHIFGKYVFEKEDLPAPIVKYIESIEISKSPEKTTYNAHEKFNSKGMEVTATYSDGSEEVLPEIEYQIMEVEDLTCLINKIEVQYKIQPEIRTEIPITVEHIEVTDSRKEATCTETGLTEGKHCEVCEKVLVEQEEIPALGHTEVTDSGKEATCTETGLTEGKHCSVCNEVLVKQEVIPALGHNYEAKVTAPTCTEKGYTTHACTRCKDSYKDTQTNALGHSFTKYTSNNNATCTQDGTKTAKCDRCNETHAITDSGSKKTHNYKNGKCTECGEQEPKLKVTSNTYKIENTYISKVQQKATEKTTVKTFKSNIQTNATEIKVLSKDGKVQEDTKTIATGMQVELKYQNETKTFTIVVSGDVNGDGKVNFLDMVEINRVRLRKKTLEREYFLAGDVTEDGKVDFKDLVKINKFRLSKITKL